MCISAGTLLAMQVGSSLLQGSAANNAAKSQAASLNY